MRLLAFLSISMSLLCHASDRTLVGTWNLVRWEKKEENDKWVARCPSPHGQITYTAQGYMAVGMNCMKSDDSKEPSTEAKDSVFYTGTYSLKDTSVTHRISNSSDPIFYGKELIREVQFNPDETITLIGKGKTAGAIRVVWKRAP